MNNDSNEIPSEVLKAFKKESKLSEADKEKFYEQAYDETTDNKNIKKGLWAKAFAESEGDEKKTQSIYIKLRVNSLTEEIENLKLKALKDEYFEAYKVENNILIFLNQEKELRNQIETNESNLYHAKLKDYHRIGDFKIAIFHYYNKTSKPYYWVSNKDDKKIHIRRFSDSIKEVALDIESYLFDLVQKPSNEFDKYEFIESEIQKGGYDFTLDDVLDFGKKMKRNKILYEEIKEILEWSKKLEEPDIKNAVKFVEEKNEEHLNVLMDDPFDGRKEYEEENLKKAREMIENSISKSNERNPEWFKAVLWEASLFAGMSPVSNELSELTNNWLKNNN